MDDFRPPNSANNNQGPDRPQEEPSSSQPSTNTPGPNVITPNTESPSQPADTPAQGEPVQSQSPQVMSGSQQPQQQPVSGSMLKKSSGGKFMKSKGMLVGLLATVLLAAGSAAAYFGYYVPNQPENRLASALMHLAEQQQVKADGQIDIKDEGGQNLAIDYSLQMNLADQQFGLDTEIGYTGATIPLEMRMLDQDIYAKISGISSLSSLLPPEYSMIAAGLQQIDNQWYVIDRSFSQQAIGETCDLESFQSLTDEDRGRISDAYQTHPLFEIVNQTDADVSGVSTTKYEVKPATSEEAAAFGNAIRDLDFVRDIRKCLGQNPDDALEPVSDEESGDDKLYIYVTGDEEIKKIETNSAMDGTEAKLTAEFTYEAVNIEKPANSRPIQDLMSQLLGGYQIQ